MPYKGPGKKSQEPNVAKPVEAEDSQFFPHQGPASKSQEPNVAKPVEAEEDPQPLVRIKTNTKTKCAGIYYNKSGNPIKPKEEDRKGFCPFKKTDDLAPGEAVFWMPSFMHFLALPLLAAGLTLAGSIDTPLCRSVTVTAGMNKPLIAGLSNIFSPVANFFLGSVGMINSIRILAAVSASAIKTFRSQESTGNQRCESIASLFELTIAMGLTTICCLAFGYLSQATASPEMNTSYTNIINKEGMYANATNFDAWVAEFCQNRYPNSISTSSWGMSYYLNFIAYGLVFFKASLKIARSGGRNLKRLLSEWVSESGLNYESVKALGFIVHSIMAVSFAIVKPSSTPSTDLNSPLHYLRYEYFIYGLSHTVFERILKSLREPSAKKYGFLPDVSLTWLAICAFSAFVPITKIAMQQVNSDVIKLCLSLSPLVYGIFVRAIGADMKKILIVTSRFAALLLSLPIRCIPCCKAAFRNPEEMSKATWITLATELFTRGVPASLFFFLAYCTSFSSMANIKESSAYLSPLQKNLATMFAFVRVVAFNASILLNLTQRYGINPVVKKIYAFYLQKKLTTPAVLKTFGWDSRERDGHWAAWPEETKKGSSKPKPPTFFEIQKMKQENPSCQAIVCKGAKPTDFWSLLERTPGGMQNCIPLLSIISFLATCFIKTFVFTLGMVVPLTEYGQYSNDPSKQDFYPYLASIFIGMLCVKATYQHIHWCNFKRPERPVVINSSITVDLELSFMGGSRSSSTGADGYESLH